MSLAKRNIPPIEAFEDIAKYCDKTRCYECIAGKRVEPENGKIDSVHYTCGIKNSDPRNWDMSELKENYKNIISCNLDDILYTRDKVLNADEKETIKRAQEIIDRSPISSKGGKK